MDRLLVCFQKSEVLQDEEDLGTAGRSKNGPIPPPECIVCSTWGGDGHLYRGLQGRQSAQGPARFVISRLLYILKLFLKLFFDLLAPAKT